jgi:hypothetical protein
LFFDHLVDQLPQVASGEGHFWRPGEEHQIGNHFVGSHGLAVDRHELPPPLGIGFILKKRLGAGRDVGEGVVDFMTGTVRQFLERGELFPLKPIVEFSVRRFAVAHPCNQERSF